MVDAELREEALAILDREESEKVPVTGNRNGVGGNGHGGNGNGASAREPEKVDQG